MVDYFVSQKTGIAPDQVDAGLKAALRTELEQLRAAAELEEPGASVQTRAALDVERIELLANARATAAGVYASPSEADLQKAYSDYLSQLPGEEFHVAHILVATEASAQALIARLRSGADFARLARETSADDSKSRGGDMGWIVSGKLPEQLTEAVKTLKPGGIAAQPVHSIYGWHVLKLLDSRRAAAPPFDQVKAQLATNLQQERYKNFLASSADREPPSASTVRR